MDKSSSQYNSASESGWTHYLDRSSLFENNFQRRGGIVDSEGKGARMEEEEEEEEEDLSMVSDASSGPPHYHDEDDQGYYVNWYSTSQYPKESLKKKMVKEYGGNRHPSLLDDTASSPVLKCPNKKPSFSGIGTVENALDFSQCFSATRIKRKPKFQKHFSFFETSLAGKQASEDPGGFHDEERK